MQRHYALAQHIELLFGRSQPPCRFALNGGQSLDLVDEVAAAALLRLDPRLLGGCRLQGLDRKLGAPLKLGEFGQRRRVASRRSRARPA